MQFIGWLFFLGKRREVKIWQNKTIKLNGVLFAWFSIDSIGFITVNCLAAFCKYYIIYEHQSYRSRIDIWKMSDTK